MEIKNINRSINFVGQIPLPNISFLCSSLNPHVDIDIAKLSISLLVNDRFMETVGVRTATAQFFGNRTNRTHH